MERHGSEVTQNGRVKVCTNALLVFELGSLDIVGCNCSGSGIGGVHGGVGQIEAGDGFSFVGLNFRGE